MRYLVSWDSLILYIKKGIRTRPKTQKTIKSKVNSNVDSEK